MHTLIWSPILPALAWLGFVALLAWAPWKRAR